MKQAKPFYLSSKWMNKANRIKRRDGYQCQESKRYGEYREAELVHHIYPLEDYPELALVDWNLLSLSNYYHNKMHNRIDNSLTSLGLYWKRKRSKEFEEWKRNKNFK